MKYESQVQDFKKALAEAKNVMVALPAQSSVDILAAGLAVYLALKQAGKETAIVTESPLLVANTNLFGVGEIKNTFPQTQNGDFIIRLDNVVMPDGSVPALDKLDWFPEGPNLNLVFHVVPGQRFEPSKVESKHTGGVFDLIITVGVTTLTELGNLYSQNQPQFSQIPIASIDNNAMNASFGRYRVLDTTVASLSQMVGQMLTDLGLPMDGETASNILIGLYDATRNLTANVNPETFNTVSLAMQAGGTNPLASGATVQAPSSAPVSPMPSAMPEATPQPTFQSPFLQPQPQFSPQPVAPVTPSPVPGLDQAALNQGFDLRAFQPKGPITVNPPVSQPQFQSQPQPQPTGSFQSFQFNPTIQPQTTPTPPTPPAQPVMPAGPIMQGEHEVQPSTPKEQTYEQGSDDSFSPQPDWLTPKVFKGSGGVS